MFRKLVFWLHLVCGVVAGLVIGIMSFTGTALAFEKQLVAFAERDARRVTPPSADAKPLPLDELARRIRAQRPDHRPSGFVITRDPRAAIALSAGGRGGGGGATAAALFANPYTAELREAASPRTSAFLRTMRSWHRWLGVEGEHRNVARAATGAGNLAFLGLAVTGLYLWWPRRWSRRAIGAIAWFNVRLSGRARDFNWHNVIGLWSAPVLIVLTATALPISYAWAGRLIFRLTGTPAPAQGARTAGPNGPAAASTVSVPRPAAGAQPLALDALLAAVQQQFPSWEQITLRTPAGPATARDQSGTHSAAPAGPSQGTTGDAAHAAPLMVTLKQSDTWPRTATTTLALDPYTGTVLQRAGYAELNRAQQVRAWTRFLHTGEALGWGGQLVAGLASFGGCVLMWTGFALAWRRFFSRTTPSNAV
jgi:uncharacterized iron-regulated membrane protein